MRCLRIALATGVLAVGAGGCGSSVTATSQATRASAVDGSAVQVTSASCSGESASTGGSAAGSCTFVLSDGRRFSCPPALARRAQLSVNTLEHTRDCRRLSTLAIPPAARRVFAAIEKTRTCLIARGLRVTGGPVFPTNPTGPLGPAGELVIADRDAPTFVAFYLNARQARLLEPEVAHNAKRLGARLGRHGAVTVISIPPSTSQFRDSVKACAFS